MTLYVGLLSYTVPFSCILDDHSLVELSLITSDEDSSYINANFIKVVGEEIKHSMFFCAPKTGMGRRLRRRCLPVVTSCGFCSPLGCLWTQGLYCHPGSFIYNCPGLLEDDLGIPYLGECRVASGALVEGAGCRM